MRKQWIRALVCAAALSGIGCGGGDEPPERHQNGLASIDEAAIEARLDGSTVALGVPVSKITSGLLQGALTIDLLDARDTEAEPVGSASIELNQSEELEVHDLVIETELEALERAETVPLIVRWRLSNDESALYGRRSLYAALGNIDVELRVPSEFSAEGESALRVIAVDPQTGDAIEDAEVTLELATIDEDGAEVLSPLAVGATDERGEFAELVSLPADVLSGSIVVTVASDDAQVTTRRSVAQRDQSQLYMSSDKTLYKPGQSVHLRLLALEGSERMPRADEEVVFEARDGRGNKVFTRTTSTDAFGVAHIDVPIDSRVNEGDWRFEAIVDGTTQRLVLPVEKYNLPRMRVEVAQTRPYALLGETVRGRVNASYLFGEPVIGANVTVQVSSGLGLVSEFISGETDAQGGFDYEFSLPESGPGNLDDLGDVISISTEIVDTAGQRETGASSLALAATPLRIALVTTPSAEGRQGFVRITDPLGRPVRADIDINGDLESTGRTDVNGLYALDALSLNEVSLDVSVEDDASRTSEREFRLDALDLADLTLTTSRSVVSPGDVAELTLSSAEFSRAHVDVYAGASVLSSAAVELVDGEAQISIPIPESARGAIVVEATAGRGSERAKSTTPLLISRDDGLRVELVTEESYRPGDDAEVGVRVTDAEGRPQVASLGMTVVDEAVFVLGGEPTVRLSSITGIDERVFANAGDTPIDPNSVASMPEEQRERAAGFLQAGLGQLRTSGSDYNSLAAEIPIVENSVRGLIDRDLQSLFDGLRSAVDDGLVTERNLEDVVTNKPIVDPFGVPYEVEVEDTRVTFRSFGPDEREDTWDDVERSRDARGLLNGWGDADDDGLRGGVPEAEFANGPPQEDHDTAGGGDNGSVKVRSDFRETALVAPTLITDSEGRASVTLHLPHSITTWRTSVDGSSQSGQFGEARGHLRTFQPFFVDFQMPTELTVGDTLTLPAIVYNYTDEEQSIRVSLADVDWLEVAGSPTQEIVLGPSEVHAARFEVTVLKAGSRSLEIRGEGDGLADALVRVAHVSPEGVAEDQSFSGKLEGSATHTVTIPSDVTDGGVYVALSVTPGFAAEAVEGLEGMVKEPNGCFEQTTSTAWPNTLVANYLETTGQMTEEKREEIIGTVTRGYQRLLTFESPTGGFNWWGDSDPGNRILSAIMLWHLKDLETLIETDDDVRARTLQWLVEQQNADGSWDAGDALHSGNESLGTNIARSTSFVAWALAHTGWAEDAVARAASYLSSNAPDEDDLYANALAANAMVMADLGNPMTTELLNRLDGMKEQEELNITWPTGAPSWTGASGDMAAIETTGLVAYGMMKADAFPSDVEGAMRYIVSNKDSVGTWYNTQATMNALRALSAAAEVVESDARGTVTVRVNDEVVESFEVTDENAELLRTFDISEHFRVGDNDVRVSMDGTDGLTYRLARVAHRPMPAATEGGLSMEIEHSATEVSVGEPVGCTVRATNGEETEQNQVMVRVGRAPGFTPMAEDLQALVDRGIVSRFEIRSNDVTFYLMAVAPGETRELSFRAIPGLVAEVTAPASEIYSYYQTDRKQTLPPMTFTVTN